jgi:hypothetical protein
MINNINLNKIDIQLDVELINQNYIDCKIFNNLYNVDIKLIYYLVMNLNKLLDYNNQPAIESELSHLIIKIIKMFNIQMNIDYTNSDVRKYDYILINQLPYMDEQIRLVGLYQELTNIDDIDNDKIKENNDILNEEQNALDVDDYEVDDDIDGVAEAFDGFE